MFQPDPERRLTAIPWKIKAPYQSGEAIRYEYDTGAKQTGAINTARLLGKHGLEFDYALIASGPKFGRAPSNRRWSHGETLSLDTAGYHEILGSTIQNESSRSGTLS